MLVYGDAERVEDPSGKLSNLAMVLRQVAAMPAGLARHSVLVGAFIEAGELAQGISDHAFAVHGRDDDTPPERAAAELLRRLAQAVCTSWTSAFTRLAPLPDPPALLPLAGLPDRIATRQAEGFAQYALYPEGYAEAAAASRLAPDTGVIGIRSIGAPLGAMVAASLGTRPAMTVRPVGHPFRRELRLGDVPVRRFAAAPAAIAVVDEGPGLSGSSFAAVADCLHRHGIAPDRMHFFPSHAGAPGPHASGDSRMLWAKAIRHVMPLDCLLLRTGRREHRLAAWVADLLCRPAVTLQEISAGNWRAHRYTRPASWPPVQAMQERRKFLARTADAAWLVKFAGLGASGQRKARQARALAQAGFGPESLGLCHGFLVQRWLDRARPLDLQCIAPDRLAEQVGRYLGFRARNFGGGPGASLPQLQAMARHNAARALGPELAGRLDAWTPAELERLAALVRPVATDNRMQAWEWLPLPDGRLLKADALDHHAGHELIGCQDIAWDLVGAVVELDLPPSARHRLCQVVHAETGRAPDPTLLAFLTPCYLAFQLGSWHMAAEAETCPDEARRLRRAAAGHAARLRALLATGPPAVFRAGEIG